MSKGSVPGRNDGPHRPRFLRRIASRAIRFAWIVAALTAPLG